MEPFKFISLILIIPILLDAVGDALRFRNKQKPHHILEALHVAAWMLIWAYFGFAWQYIVMYTLARVVLFDVVFNLSSGLKLGYVGESSIYGWLVSWFSGKVREPGILVWVIRAMCLIAWMVLFFVIWP